MLLERFKPFVTPFVAMLSVMLKSCVVMIRVQESACSMDMSPSRVALSYRCCFVIKVH